jgi:DNA-binding transcriptional LysR family regulator
VAVAGVSPRHVLESGNAEAIKRYVVAGVGIAALPAVAAEDEVQVPSAMTAFPIIIRELLSTQETGCSGTLAVAGQPIDSPRYIG